MADANIIAGAKGGGSSQRAPVESPDSLRSIATFRILDLISEGEIGGLVNGLQSVYLDETPLQNPDGSYNFTGVQVDTRTGTQDQTYIPGYPAVENEITVGVELRSDAPWTRQLANVALSAVAITIAVPQLSKANTTTGDISGYSVAYHIDVATDGGAFVIAYTGAITGKTTTTYQRTHRIDLPAASTGWQVRVVRTTVNANSATIADTTNITSYTEIIDAKLRYPNSALMAVSGDASEFTNIPARAYNMFLRIVKVPTNYNPLTRVYTGIWDGTFKPAWSDNPAWCFYDLVLHPRYGLGHLISAAQVDKWELYRIGQYCDQDVDDGKGGKEPRFTLNAYLQTTADAYKLISDLAGMFNGLSFWAGGAIVTHADMPEDPAYLYTAANVIGGTFTYASSARKTRYTTALVSWNDPADFYRIKTEYVEDDAGLARYGIQNTSLTAFGCTSQGQAQRAGRWATVTSLTETGTVSFSVGLDGALAAPGQIIRVQDPARAGARQGGRIRAATRTAITPDKPPAAVAVGDSLTVLLTTGVTQTLAITSTAGGVLTVAAPGFASAPQGDAAWMVESATLAAQTFRVLTVTEDDSQTDLSFTLSCVQHVAGKFSAIDNGTIIQIPPISGLTPNNQAPPTNVTLAGHTVITQGIATNVLTITWTPAAGAVAYQVEWRRNDGQWISAGRVSAHSLDIPGIYTGDYMARVRSINPSDIISIPAYGGPTAIIGKTGLPPAVVNLQAQGIVFGIVVSWAFPAGATDTERTELWASQSPNRVNASKISDLAYPQNTYTLNGLAAGSGFYFWARLVDKTGNIGPWTPVGDPGVYAESSADADAILSYLTGQITETELSQDLLDQIDKIDQIDDLSDEMAALAEELDQTQSEVEQISGIIAQYTPAKMAGDTLWAGDDTYYAGVWSETYARAAADEVLAKEIDTVAATAGGWQAAIQTETTARLTADEALAQQITTVQANVDGNSAAIQIETTARVNADQAQASQITDVQADLGDTNAAVQTNATAIAKTNGTVSASYTIKVQIDPGTGKYVGAGMAVGIDNNTGITQSQILFYADRFALLQSANGVISAPFVIQGGQTFISQAFIGTAWITTAKIADAAVTNAKIGGVIQSDNYSSSAGWMIDKAGNAVFNTATIRGNLDAGSITGIFQSSVVASGAIGLSWTLPAPVKAGESHKPIIFIGVDVLSQSGGQDFYTVALERNDGGTWVNVHSFTEPAYLSTATQTVIWVDAAQTAAKQYRLRNTAGQVSITNVQIYSFGQR